MLPTLFWLFFGLAIVMVIGGMQWLKGWAKTAPPALWRVLVAVLSIGVGLLLAAVFGVPEGIPASAVIGTRLALVLLGLFWGVLLLAVCELGYEIILKGIVDLLRALVEWIKAAVARKTESGSA